LNISSLTGKVFWRTAPYYKDTERASIISNSILDRLAINFVTGSNVFMSDNPWYSLQPLRYLWYSFGIWKKYQIQ